MSENQLIPNLLYNRDFSWVKIDGDIATLGVIKPAADKVKEFVFIKLPKLGQVLKIDEVYVSVEAVKWSGHLTSPLSGEIIEVNDPLFDEPSIINRDPYGEGWVIRLKISNRSEIDKLISAEEANEWLESVSKK
jgi:glycine cleavage system H protein